MGTPYRWFLKFVDKLVDVLLWLERRDAKRDRKQREAEERAHMMGMQGSRYVGKTAGRAKARSPRVRRGKARNAAQSRG